MGWLLILGGLFCLWHFVIKPRMAPKTDPAAETAARKAVEAAENRNLDLDGGKPAGSGGSLANPRLPEGTTPAGARSGTSGVEFNQGNTRERGDWKLEEVKTPATR